MPTDISQQLAAFVAGARPGDIPEAVRHDGRRAILNNLAAGLGGCRDPAIDAMLAVIVPQTGPVAASVIGRSVRLDFLNAAWINAAIGNVLDFDDTHLPTVIHPTSPIAPALLALAEHRSAAGRPIAGAALLDAFALGVEIACRVGNSVSPAHYIRGWHITGTCGVLGAAAAAARLIGLDAERTRWALANAATQAAGLVEMIGFNSKSLNPANAARNGLLSALLAEAGLSGPAHPLEGQRGFLRVLGDNADLARLTEGLGRTWELSRNALKPYPCGVVLHPVIDACLDLRAEAGFSTAAIDRIVVRGHPLLKERTDRRVKTGREAQVCLSHTVAVALLLGRAGVAEYTDALVNDPAVCAVGDRVTIEVDDGIPVEAAGVVLHLKGGHRREAYVPHARGSIGRPLTDAEIEAKLRELTALTVPGLDTARLIDAVWSLGRAPDAAVAIRCAAGSAA